MTAAAGISDNAPGPIEAITYSPPGKDGPHRSVWLYASACAADQSLAALHDMGAQYLELRRHSLASPQDVIRFVFDEGVALDDIWRALHGRGWLLEVHQAVESGHRAALGRAVLRPALSRRRARRVRR